MAKKRRMSAAFRVANLVALGVAALLQGCAGVATLGGTPEDVVKARAEARWHAMVGGDWEKAYAYSTPSYRAAVDLPGFITRYKGAAARKGAEVQSARCEAETCTVVVRLRFEPVLQRGYGELNTDVDERWVKEGDSWYVFLRQ